MQVNAWKLLVRAEWNSSEGKRAKEECQKVTENVTEFIGSESIMVGLTLTTIKQ